jgi:DNA-binding CsgD family transcriptional regulator
MTREELQRYRGREVQATPTGFVAVFDGPARAIRCAMAVVERGREMGLSVRAGLHTGDWDLTGNGIRGVASEITAKVLAHAAPEHIVVTSTVTMLAADSHLIFKPLGTRPITYAGHRLDLYRVLPDASHTPTGTSAGITAADSDTPLSPREREIATLIGQGLTNRRIADRLSISIATVERHASNIFTKLGFHSRTQVARWAAEHGLPVSDPD